METLNWSFAKKAFYLLMIAFMVASTAACAKKSGKSGVSSRTNRGGSTGYRDDAYNPSSGQRTVDWGAIEHSGQRILEDFMAGADVGTVSSSASDDTGIRFRRDGNKMYILVWDKIANTHGDAFYWGMTIKRIEGGINQNYAVITASDDIGTIIFDGNISGGVWDGDVLYDNGNGRETLGSFSIYTDLVFER